MDNDDDSSGEQLGPAYTAGQVAVLLGCDVDDLGEMPLLCLPSRDDQAQYPAFQLATDERRRTVGQVVEALDRVVASRWTVASWLTGPHPDLDGAHTAGRHRRR